MLCCSVHSNLEYNHINYLYAIFVLYAAWQLLFTMNFVIFHTAYEFRTTCGHVNNDCFYFWVNGAFKEGFAL